MKQIENILTQILSNISIEEKHLQDEVLQEPEKELKEEIEQFRQKNKEFKTTNDKETYLIVVFSCKEDKQKFLKEIKIDTHTLVDGYELARNIGVNPKIPSLKLKPYLKGILKTK